MLALITTLSSLLVCRFRSRAALELDVIALRHQLAVLRRQQPGRPKLTSLDGLLWVWLYRVWPRCLKVMVLVKSATVVECGFPALLAVAFTGGTAASGSRGP